MALMVIAAVSGMGYYFAQNGKRPRAIGTEPPIPKSSQPLSPLIYENSRLKEVDEYVRKLAADKHAQRNLQFPPEPIGVDIIPNMHEHVDTLPAHVKESSPDSAAARFERQRRDLILDETRHDLRTGGKLIPSSSVAAFDPTTGLSVTSGPERPSSSPLFKSNTLRFPGQEAVSEFGAPISLLSGLATDMTHSHMQPMYGGYVKQTGVANQNSQVLLERFTGVSSTDDQGTYRPRVEVLNPLPMNPEDPRKAAGLMDDLYQRAYGEVRQTKEFMTPTTAFRDAPMTAEQIRVLPYNIDQTRGVGKQQITFGGPDNPMPRIPNQISSSRAMLPPVPENRWDLTQEQTTDNFLPVRTAMNGAVQVQTPTIRNSIATEVTTNNYLGPPVSSRTFARGDEQAYKAQLDETVTRRRNEVIEPQVGLARGANMMGPNTGSFVVRQPNNKGEQLDYVGVPSQTGSGTRWQEKVALDPTLKDQFALNTVGPINESHPMKLNDAYKNVDVNAKVTSKEMYADNQYLPAARSHQTAVPKRANIAKWITKKEMLEQQAGCGQLGHPTSHIPKHMSYDSVFEKFTNKEVDNDRLGIAAVSIRARTLENTDDLSKELAPELLVTDYITNPRGTQKAPVVGDTDGRFAVPKVEFGGHLAPDKVGNGEDGKRTQLATVAPEKSVERRFEMPRIKDGPTEGPLPSESNLRPDVTEQTREHMIRTQPIENVGVNQPAIMIRQRNVETVNPRLDDRTFITNDLYPYTN